MYNRYTPQADGSYRRNRVAAPCPPPQPCNKPQPSPCPPPEPPRPAPEPPCRRPPERRKETGVGSFLKNLLPKDFDTGDLIIILLLLLMAGDCAEDQNTALLTLALYLFM